MALCLSCTSDELVVDDDIDYCKKCGYLHYFATPTPPTDTDASQAKKHEQFSPEVKAPTARAWLDQHAGSLGDACLLRAFQILDRLEAPFMRGFPDRTQIAGKRLPWFSFDLGYTEEIQEIVRRLPPATRESSDEWMWQKWQLGKKDEITAVLRRLPEPERTQTRSRWETLTKLREKKMLDRLPDPERDAVEKILRLCSKDMRTKVLLLDCRIRWFLKCEPSWDSFPSSSPPETPRRSRDKILAKLTRARAIAEDARTCLKDAMEFHGPKPSPIRKAMNQALLHTCQSVPSIRKLDAARLVSDLLTHIDPQHPVKRDPLRVAPYPSQQSRRPTR